MKALVAYYSDGGNTEKLARAVYDGIKHVEKEIKSIEDVKEPEGYDLIFVGFPVQSHTVAKQVEDFIKTIPKGKKLAFFATHGSLRGGPLAITAFYYALSLTSKETVLGTFGCRGEVKSALIESLMNQAEHRGWAMEAQSAKGHPDEADLEDAREWAGWMVGKARTK